MIKVSIAIKAPVSRVWDAITDKSQMKDWYFDIQDFVPETGAVFNFYEPGNARQFHHRCKILEIIPMQKFSHTWTHPSHSKGESLVTWLLESVGDTTNLILIHEGTENFKDGGSMFSTESYLAGWNELLLMLKNYICGLRKHSFRIHIRSTAVNVWNALFDDQSYRKWTSVFCEGSYLEGELKQGGRVRFLTPKGNGMYSNVVVYKLHQQIVFQHIGNVSELNEEPVDDNSEKWTGAREGYTLEESGNSVLLTVDIDLSPDDAPYFEEHFPKGLELVREMATSHIS
ncbi:MAG TPA: SRPBCC family protein [Lentimicrobium sp.]|nr:SRPBCC family protein [Lentimicrobium sp.]